MSRRAFPGIHLNGSVPLGRDEDVFRWVAANLSAWVSRIPDGQVGVRPGPMQILLYTVMGPGRQDPGELAIAVDTLNPRGAQLASGSGALAFV